MIDTWDPNPCCSREQYTISGMTESQGVFKMPALMVNILMVKLLGILEARHFKELQKV